MIIWKIHIKYFTSLHVTIAGQAFFNGTSFSGRSSTFRKELRLTLLMLVMESVHTKRSKHGFFFPFFLSLLIYHY